MMMSQLGIGPSKGWSLQRRLFVLLFCYACVGASVSAQEVSWDPSNYSHGDTISLVLDDWVEESISVYSYSFSPPFLVDSGSVINLDTEMSSLGSGVSLIGSASWDNQTKLLSLQLRREDGNPIVEDSIHAVFKGIIVTVEDIIFKQASAPSQTTPLSLFPQRVDTHTLLQIPSDMHVHAIRLLDHRGQVIQEYSSDLRKLSLLGLSAGWYMVLVETATAIYPLRLIKQ